MRFAPLPLAAALLASGCTLARCDVSNPRNSIFYILGEDVSGLASAYVMGSLSVDAKTLFRKFDDLRTMVRKVGPGESK